MSARKFGAISLYSIGVLITLVLFCLFLSRSNHVLFPNAMLPAQLWEQATEWLALGAVPMAVASLIFYKTIFTEKPVHHKRKMLLIYTPAIICACFLMFWVCVWAIGFFNTFSHLIAENAFFIG